MSIRKELEEMGNDGPKNFYAVVLKVSSERVYSDG